MEDERFKLISKREEFKWNLHFKNFTPNKDIDEKIL